MTALEAGITDCAEDLVGKAQAAAPVDTGTLQASIHVESVTRSGRSVTAIVSTGGEADYAVFQHEGTSRGVPATKFLERPLVENTGVYREFIARAARGAF
jgi:HK97 gp10 family phage protein